MSDLHPLMDAIRIVRIRTFADAFLARCAKFSLWSFPALQIAAVFFPQRWVLLAALVVLTAVVAVSALLTWRSRPSDYRLAQNLDQAAGLQDRLSTALHLASSSNASENGEIAACQRRDALARLSRIQPRALFAAWRPELFKLPLVLAAVFCVLLVYRPGQQAPGVRLLERAQSELRQTLRSLEASELFEKKQAPPPPKPIALENLLAGLRPELAGTMEAEKGAAPPQQAGSSTPGEEGSAPQSSDDSAEAEGGLNSDQEGSASAKSAQSSSASEQQKGNQSGGPGEQQQKGQSPSLAQKLKQAFNGLMAALNRNSANPEQNAKAPSGGKDGQSEKSANEMSKDANSGQNAAGKTPNAPSDKDSSAAGDQAMAVKGTGTQGGLQPPAAGSPGEESFGNQPGESQQAQTTPEVVPLQATPFKGEAKMRAELEPGKVMVPYSNAAAAGNATTNGAEHGAVPLRYRAYVRRYFDHSAKSSGKAASSGNGN
ncbi:MAG: hypothetical protein AB7O65_00595 [Candidatus Korobacteraceae bacterium]